MNLRDKRVAIVGAGVTGLAAADEVARWGAGITILEQASHIGGHAAHFSCKALDECVACGACLAHERRMRVAKRDNVSILTGVRITRIQGEVGFVIRYDRPDDPHPVGEVKADALLLTTGFRAYDPSPKPYGYRRFPNVLTLLEAEDRLGRHGRLTRPSDAQPPEHIAFIQCVGSRDSRLGHPWCSKICCGAALRMARLIQHRQPNIAVTFFYIDVQTFGKNFQQYYDQTRRQVRMVRAIPGDIVQAESQRLQVAFFDPEAGKASDAQFDLVILATGITPCPENVLLADMLGIGLADSGFFVSHASQQGRKKAGIFTAGAALGPMSIAECLDSAGKAAWDLVNYLKMTV